MGQGQSLSYGMHVCLEEPDSSAWAVVWASLQLSLTLLSTILLLVSDVYYEEPPASFVFLEMVSIIFFTVDYVLRLLVCPDLRDFALDCLNVIDVLVIAPFFVLLLLHGSLAEAASSHGVLLRLLRLFRLARLTKFSHILTSPFSPADAIQGKNIARFHRHIDPEDKPPTSETNAHHHTPHMYVVDNIDTRFTPTQIVVDSMECFGMPAVPTTSVTVEVMLLGGNRGKTVLSTDLVTVCVQDWYSQVFSVTDPIILPVAQSRVLIASAPATPTTSPTFSPRTPRAAHTADDSPPIQTRLKRASTDEADTGDDDNENNKGLVRARSENPKTRTGSLSRHRTEPPPKTSDDNNNSIGNQKDSPLLLTHAPTIVMPQFALGKAKPTLLMFVVKAENAGEAHFRETVVLDLKEGGLLKHFNQTQEKALKFRCGAQLLVLLRVEAKRKPSKQTS